MALPLLFFGATRYSIFEFDSFLSKLLYVTLAKFKIINRRYVITLFLLIFFVPNKKKRFLIAKLPRINNVVYYVHRLSVSDRMNVKTSQKMLGVHR